MLELNQKEQEGNRNSFIQSIFWYFFKKFWVNSGCFGLFRFVLKMFVSVVSLLYQNKEF